MRQRIDLLAAFPNFVVQMRASGEACIANQTDWLPPVNSLTLSDHHFQQMAVKRLQTKAMID